MPADKALRRYRMEIVGYDKDKDGKPIRVTLQIHPKLRNDAANYQLATVILDLTTYLPTAVRMIDPMGTKETVYSFVALKANARANILPSLIGLGEKDPFKPNLKGMKVVVQAPVDERADGTPDKNQITQVGGTALVRPPVKSENKPHGPPTSPKQAARPTVPSVVGLDYHKAKELLEQLDYKVSLVNGSVAERQEDIHRIERQTPDPKTNLPQGAEVKLWVFRKPKVSAEE